MGVTRGGPVPTTPLPAGRSAAMTNPTRDRPHAGPIRERPREIKGLGESLCCVVGAAGGGGYLAWVCAGVACPVGAVSRRGVVS